MKLNWTVFKQLGLEIISRWKYEKNGEPTTTDDRDFRSQFGVNWHVCEHIWSLLDEYGKYRGCREPKHLLWALLFLKVYGNETTHAGIVFTSPKTFRKWAWNVTEELSELSVLKICWEKRKDGDIGNDCLISVDGVDFEILEPFPYEREWSKRWFSPKFKGPGLRYEVGVSILKGDIVWINGPFPCGLWNDYKIFKEGGLKDHLDPMERVEADDGYAVGDPEFVKTRSGVFHPEGGRDVRNCVCARHETVNKRMKQFGALSSVFHHNLSKHNLVFEAVAMVTQTAIEMGEPLFKIDDYDDTNNVDIIDGIECVD